MKKPSTSSTLKDAFNDDFYIGAALSLNQILRNEPESLALAAKQFNSITPENILKWEEVHPEPNRYNFEPVDRFVDWGEKHSMHIIGHTLVWFYQTPDWVFRDDSGRFLDREKLLERMKDHIFTVMGRYKGRIHGWDVVNEAVAADGQLRKNKWLEIIGEDYILKAYQYAREADPHAQLYYNEYDYEMPAKCEGVIRLIRSLQSHDIKIDGIGIQGHWFLDYPAIDEIERYIVALSSLGVKLMITELDVGVLPYYPVDSVVVDISSFDAEKQKTLNPYPEFLPDAIQKNLTDRYAALFSLILKHREKFGRVTFWAVHDAQSWRNYQPIKGITDYPMLFDRQCKAKPAFDAIIELAKRKNQQ